MSVRGKAKVKNELGFAFMAVNLRKYAAMNSGHNGYYNINPAKNGANHLKLMIGAISNYCRLVMSQPLFILFCYIDKYL